MYLKKDSFLTTNVYHLTFYYLIKNILILKRCGYVFRMLVKNKTYVINLVGSHGFYLYVFMDI